MLDAIYDEDRVNSGSISSIAAPMGDKIAVSEREDRDAIEKTVRVAPAAILGTDQPSPSDAGKLVGRVAEGAPAEPNLLLEIILAALAKERYGNRQLDSYIREAEGHQKTIDRHLEARAQLDSLPPDRKSHDIKPELRDLLVDLGVWKNEEKNPTLTKEQLGQIKSSLSANTDQARSKVQLLVTTKMQTTLQNSSAIMEITKESVRTFSRMISTIIGHYARNN